MTVSGVPMYESRNLELTPVVSDNRSRGRQRAPVPKATSWIRSASASGLLRLQRHGHSSHNVNFGGAGGSHHVHSLSGSHDFSNQRSSSNNQNLNPSQAGSTSTSVKAPQPVHTIPSLTGDNPVIGSTGLTSATPLPSQLTATSSTLGLASNIGPGPNVATPNPTPLSPQLVGVQQLDDGTNNSINDIMNNNNFILNAEREGGQGGLVVDVLPSFEMYNALHRHIPQGNVNPDLHDFPPSYREVQDQDDSIARGSESTQTTLDNLQLPGNNNNNNSGNSTTMALPFPRPASPGTDFSASALNTLHPLATQHLNIHTVRSGSNNSNIIVNCGSSSNNNNNNNNSNSIAPSISRSRTSLPSAAIASVRSSSRSRSITRSHSRTRTQTQSATRSVSTRRQEEDRISTATTTTTTTAAAAAAAAAAEDNIPIQDDLNDKDNIFIDKLYTLPKRSTPVEIEIKITKHFYIPPARPEEESILKEYTTGDVIHGYCIIQNVSSQPLKFEMFYVTLEAYTSTVDKEKNKRTVKRFLRMVDLSASWSYTNIDMANGFKLIPGQIDFDNSVIGLTNSRVLEPGVKYKKFFTFKFPKQLLDVTCKQEHFAHCLLPPSFGIDKYRNNFRYAQIKVNNALGCGHLGTKGSPILTTDFVGDSLSVNYTIDARIVGKDKVTHKLNIMKEQEYNVRFVPFGFDSSLVGERESSKQVKDMIQLVEDRLGALKLIFKRLKNREPIKNEDIHGTELSGTLDDGSNLSSEELMRRKLAQLHVKNRYNSEELGHYSKSPFDDIKKLAPPAEDLLEAELSYVTKHKNRHKHKSKGMSLFSGLLTSVSGSTEPRDSTENNGSNDVQVSHPNDVGLILISTSRPHRSLPYLEPSLLRKTNKFDTRTKQDQENWLSLLATVPEYERQPLDHLKLNLSCIQSNNSAPHDPPEIQNITTDLLVVTGRSENSIPIKLDAKLLLNTEKLNKVRDTFSDYLNKIAHYREKFKENLQELNRLYNMNRADGVRERELKFSDFVSNQIMSDIESLANLKVQVEQPADVFKKQEKTLKDDFELSRANTSSELTATKSNYGRLTPTHSSSGSSSSTAAKYLEQIVHKWIKKAPMEYEREVIVNLEYSTNNTYTLVPSFESCLCCRFYVIRVTLKFHHVGSVYIDVPVDVKHL